MTPKRSPLASCDVLVLQASSRRHCGTVFGVNLHQSNSRDQAHADPQLEPILTHVSASRHTIGCPSTRPDLQSPAAKPRARYRHRPLIEQRARPGQSRQLACLLPCSAVQAASPVVMIDVTLSNSWPVASVGQLGKSWPPAILASITRWIGEDISHLIPLRKYELSGRRYPSDDRERGHKKNIVSVATT